MKFKSWLPILSILLVCIAPKINSQPALGFQAGLNLSSFEGHKDYDENKPRLGLSAYVFTDIPLGYNSIVSIETGLGFIQQGMNHTRITDDIASRHTLTVKNRMDYVFLPIYLKENLTNFYTKIGPYGSYLVNVESTWKDVEEQSFQVINESTGVNEDFVKNANEYDFGLSFGFGYIHYFENARYRPRRRRGKRVVTVLQVDLRYNLGLMKIDKTGHTADMDYKNRVFTLGLSITTVQNK